MEFPFFRKKSKEVASPPQPSPNPEIKKAAPEPERHQLTLPGGENTQIALTDFEKAFPNTQIIERGFDNERPLKERIPSIARMDRIPPDEKIWLTNHAVRERLTVLLHTDNRFNLDPAVAIAAYSRETDADGFPLKAVETSKRNPVPPQQMLQEFERMGFAFAKVNENPVMVIDATIPAAKNTNGRLKAAQLGSISNQQGDFYGKAFTAHDEGKSGIQPATMESSHAIIMPVGDILKIHKDTPGIEHWHFNRDQAANSLQGSKIMNNASADVIDMVILYFRRMGAGAGGENDPRVTVIQERIKEIRNEKAWGRKKDKLYDMLNLVGLEGKHSIINDGYFPYEPVYHFPQYATSEDISYNTLNNLSETLKPGDIPVNLMLDEILLAV